MQQLSFLDPPTQQDAVPAYSTLDEEQRAALVTKLARLIAKTVESNDPENDND